LPPRRNHSQRIFPPKFTTVVTVVKKLYKHPRASGSRVLSGFEDLEQVKGHEKRHVFEAERKIRKKKEDIQRLVRARNTPPSLVKRDRGHGRGRMRGQHMQLCGEVIARPGLMSGCNVPPASSPALACARAPRLVYAIAYPLLQWGITSSRRALSSTQYAKNALSWLSWPAVSWGFGIDVLLAPRWQGCDAWLDSAVACSW
jgi:hypothetical protein